MEAPSSTTDREGQSETPPTDRKQYLATLYKNGGFVLACETVVTLHKINTSEDGPKWDIIDYGILAVVSKEAELSLLVGDLDSGELVHEFTLTSASKYAIQKPHFHSFVVSDGSVCGLSFADVEVAKKISKVLRQLLPKSEDSEVVDVPHPKRQKLDDNYSDWVIINSEDVPAVTGANEASIGKIEGDRETGVDETDLGLFGKKEKKREFKIDDISGPSYFRHMTHVGVHPPVMVVSQIEYASTTQEGEGEQGAGRTGTFERGTKRSSSFMEFSASESQPTPQPLTESPAGLQPASSSSGGLTGSSSFASSFSGSSFGMLEPPSYVNDHDTLLSQINTFDRRSLHHISSEQIARTKNRTDSNDKQSLTAIFRSGFDKLLPKLQLTRQVSTVATINSKGEEEGWDGPIFL